jgi:plasmid stabilization system protein ParE
MNDIKFLLSKPAYRDIENIIDYIANDLSNPSAAISFRDKLYSSFKTVCMFPESCPYLTNEYVKDKTLRKMVVDNYIAFYRYEKENNRIIVMRVLYGLSNYFEIL